jgi:hypothetical protein
LFKSFGPILLIKKAPIGAVMIIEKIVTVYIICPYTSYSELPKSVAVVNITGPKAAYTVALGTQAQAIKILSFMV